MVLEKKSGIFHKNNEKNKKMVGRLKSISFFFFLKIHPILFFIKLALTNNDQENSQNSR